MTWPTPDLQFAVRSLEWFFIGYFLLVHFGHTLLAVVSMNNLRRHIDDDSFNMLPRLLKGYEIPLSIIVPVDDSIEDIERFVHALLEADYPDFEIILVADGANTDTLAQLRDFFELEIFPEAVWRQVRAKAVHGVYRSVKYPKLRLVDKGKGGMGDTINAGANAAHYPVICIAHPDCGLNPTSLRQLVQIFVDDPNAVASGTASRLASRSQIAAGLVQQPAVSGRLSSLVQVTANLRRDLCGRHGWAELNACLAFSDRLCAFRKRAFVESEGCDRDAINPVLELLGRMHRRYSVNEEPYRIAYMPAPLVWQPIPTKLTGICRSVAMERRGLSDAMTKNNSLLWRHWTGPVGRLAFPFLALTEIAGPSIEVLAILFFLSAFAFDLISGQHLIAFAMCSAGLGVLVSWLAVILDAFVFRTYAGANSYIRLFVGALFENIGYRQLMAFCGVSGFPLRAPGRYQKIVANNNVNGS